MKKQIQKRDTSNKIDFGYCEVIFYCCFWDQGERLTEEIYLIEKSAKNGQESPL